MLSQTSETSMSVTQLVEDILGGATKRLLA
jgi:hypothetical protein